MKDYPLIIEAFQDQAWAILPAKLDEIVAFFEAKLAGQPIEWPAAAAGKNGNRAEEPYQLQDGVAVIPIFGTLAKRMNLFSQMSGGTSYQLLAQQYQQALADSKVKAILLEVDSPGGVADGIKTAADIILAGRGQKPVVTWASGMMASAAYWLGSAADQIVAEDTTHAGSIGVVMTHFDRSGQDAARGVKRTHIFAGKFKVAGSDAQPLSPEDQAYFQGMIEHLNQLFLASVGQHRGLDSQAVHEQMGDGRLFIGRQALDAGLVDQIGTKADALALAKQMASKPGQGGMRMDKEQLQKEHPELYAEVMALGAAGVTLEVLLEKQPEAVAKLKAEGQEAGVQAERERVVEIIETASGLKDGLLLQILKNGTGVKDACKLMVANHEQMKAETLKAMYGAAAPVLGTEVPKIENHAQDNPDASLETRAKAEWEKNPALKTEFSTFERYMVVKKHEGDIKSK